MEIGGLQRFSVVDFPKRVSCVVFLWGCNFRCPFCHNSELVLETLKPPLLSERDLFDFLEKRKGLLEGVVISGGEPTIYKELGNFLLKIKEFGFKIKLDTNGSFPERLEGLIKRKLLDYVAMDIKAPIRKYFLLAGRKVSVEKIQESVEILKEAAGVGIGVEFRTTFVKPLLEVEDILFIREEFGLERFNYFVQIFREPSDKKIIADLLNLNLKLFAPSKEEIEFLKKKHFNVR